MPLKGRVVEPLRICQISHITNSTAELSSVQNTHNLEETTYIALVGKLFVVQIDLVGIFVVATIFL